MKDRAKGRMRGQSFPSTAVHDSIPLHSERAIFPGTRPCSRSRHGDTERGSEGAREGGRKKEREGGKHILIDREGDKERREKQRDGNEDEGGELRRPGVRKCSASPWRACAGACRSRPAGLNAVKTQLDSVDVSRGPLCVRDAGARTRTLGDVSA